MTSTWPWLIKHKGTFVGKTQDIQWGKSRSLKLTTEPARLRTSWGDFMTILKRQFYRRRFRVHAQSEPYVALSVRMLNQSGLVLTCPWACSLLNDQSQPHLGLIFWWSRRHLCVKYCSPSGSDINSHCQHRLELPDHRLSCYRPAFSLLAFKNPSFFVIYHFRTEHQSRINILRIANKLENE